MIIKHLFEGGIYFMAPIYIMWIVVIFLSVKFLLNYFSDNKDHEKLKKQNSTIIFIGSFSFLFGIFGQTLGIFGALTAIQNASDIAPSLIAGGLKVSLLTTLYGFSLLLLSSIIWFVFRSLLKK